MRELPAPAEPAEQALGGSLPLEPHDGLTPVAITIEWEAIHLVADPLPRTIARVALPAVASSLLMTLFTSVDAFWIGTRIGASGLAAVSIAVFWIWLIISVAEMVNVGLTAVASRRYGEGRADAAARVAGDALLLSLALGVLSAAIGLPLLQPMFAAMHAPPEVAAMGARYFGTYLLGAPLIYGFFAVDAAFRSAGDTRTPFIILTASVAVTLVLDPVLIVGWGPVPPSVWPVRPSRRSARGPSPSSLASRSSRGAASCGSGVLTRARSRRCCASACRRR